MVAARDGAAPEPPRQCTQPPVPLDFLPPHLLLKILTAPIGGHRVVGAACWASTAGSFASGHSQSKGGGVGGAGHALDGVDLARLALVSRAFALECGVGEFEGRSVVEEAARHIVLARCSAGLVASGSLRALPKAPRSCAVATPAGAVPLSWPAALGAWTAPLTLRSDLRRVDTSDTGRSLLEMVREHLAPDAAAAIVRRGMTSGTAVCTDIMRRGRHFASFTLLEGNCAVGVCAAGYDPSGPDLYCSMTDKAWCWDSFDGFCLHAGEITGASSGADVSSSSAGFFGHEDAVYRAGDTVGLLLDCEGRCVWAYKHGKRLGLLCDGLPSGGLSWCVEVKSRGCALIRKCPAAICAALPTAPPLAPPAAAEEENENEC